MVNYNRLSRLRERYRDFNREDFNVRVRKAAPIENWILQTLNHYGFQYENQKIQNWQRCSGYDDRTLKRDAFAERNGERVYAQIKFRQPNSGDDVGCALIQPYPGSQGLVRQILGEHTEHLEGMYGRDYKFDGVLYACLNNTWDKLRLIPHQEIIKKTYTALLLEWLQSVQDLNEFSRTFASTQFQNCELKWKQDTGRGYDAGQEKILAYLPASYLEQDCRVQVVEMLDPPDSLLN